MRFRSHELGDLRRGELTLRFLPFERKPLHLKPAGSSRTATGLYSVERVQDVPERRTHKKCEGRGCARCDHGQITDYMVKCATLEGELVRVLSVNRLALAAVSDDDALQAGFESAEEWRDVFACDHGDWSEVWRVEFEYVPDVPRMLQARPSSRKPDGPEHLDDDLGYTHSFRDALRDEPESVDGATLDSYAKRNRERYEDHNAGRLGEDEARTLATKLKELRKRAARTGVNVTLEMAVIQHQLDEIERKVDEAA